MTRLRRGFWCECHTDVLVGSFTASTPHQAVHWISIALHAITPALDPIPADQARPVLHHDHAQAVRELDQGDPVTLTLRHRTTTITWTARPVLYLPMAHRQGRDSPDCLEEFSHPASQPE